MIKPLLLVLATLLGCSQCLAAPSQEAKDEYIRCMIKAAVDTRAEGLDFWAAQKAGARLCKAEAGIMKDKKIAKLIYSRVANLYAGE